MDWPTLSTTRLTFHPIEEADRDLYVTLLHNDQVMRYLNRLPSKNKTSDSFSYLLRQMRQTRAQYVFWRITVKETGTQPGFVSLVFDHNKQEANLGMVIFPDAGQRGFASEAISLFARTALQESWTKSVVCLSLPANQAATRLMQRLRFTQIGTVEIDNEQHNHWLYEPELASHYE